MKRKKQQQRVQKILPGYGLHFVAVSGRQKKKKTPSSRKNSNVKLRQKAENASLYKTNSWWMAPTIFTRAKDIPVALFLSLPVLFFFVFLVWLNAKKRGNQAAVFASVQSGSLNAQQAIDCN